MLENYNINDYLKDDKELQKAVIQELLEDFQCAIMNVENLLETKQRLKAELTELKAENERLKEEILKWQKAYSRQYQINENKGYNKKEEQYRQTLQEIKAIAEELLEKGLEPQSVEHQLRLRGKRELTSIILDLITKTESEVE